MSGICCTNKSLVLPPKAITRGQGAKALGSCRCRMHPEPLSGTTNEATSAIPMHIPALPPKCYSHPTLCTTAEKNRRGPSTTDGITGITAAIPRQQIGLDGLRAASSMDCMDVAATQCA
mmetsp:Transcript_72121/g.127110  ORF Transcript_72121/g.127110 Transcript_72121/m.127110 type:complete len:119 (-) Transcript_72121:87-443(-)